MSNTSSKRQSRGWFKLSLLLVITVAAAAVYFNSAYSEQSQEAPAAAAPPPPVAEFVTVTPQEVRIWTGFSGRLSAVDMAEIKPLVGGELQQVLFEDAQKVEKGDLLFVIDPRPYQAAVKRAEAQLTSARSRAKLAKDELDRSEQLVKKKLVSESVFDAAKNEFQVATAAIEEASSALAQAKLDLDYCYIRAPFAGQVSRAELTVGNIIETSPNAPVLTTLVANDKLYAEFDIDEQTYLRSMRHSQGDKAMPVEMTLAADTSVTYQGKIHSFDNQLDVSSGTIRARAIFDNTDGALTPGMYANVRLGTAETQSVLLIPERAVGTNQDKKFVYVINDNDEVSYHEVTLGAHHKGSRIVLSGLQKGDRVVVNGLSHIRPNSKVTAKPAEAQQVAVTE
ncbi:efflux RND transporter periplasmic adaptor subunit [Methylophaga sp.]|jgi:multidrug efflux system membrane fusion protein|uniref:efflux RND transporter periplasmic adaptor subunit n=1 Tax=Methylophaga sp. TaxID=2024840 RepID=UPI0014006CE6|nr:efflux RND transporter periplasmic adaptor subunit [Methylophaga sp.]MTI64544.1 efflux RND transporter periplasmic adaptor subunit [Methylophaga sp.]